MSPELEAAIERARHYKMSPRERFEQKVSFVYGMQDFDAPGRSKDEIRRMLAEHGGYPDKWAEDPSRRKARKENA